MLAAEYVSEGLFKEVVGKAIDDRVDSTVGVGEDRKQLKGGYLPSLQPLCVVRVTIGKVHLST